MKSTSGPATRPPRPGRLPGSEAVALLLDVGNTHTHLGLVRRGRIVRTADLKTSAWKDVSAPGHLMEFLAGAQPVGGCLCSVVPAATPRVQETLQAKFGFEALQLSPATVKGVGINYPRPGTIGQDRLANAVAVRHHFGAPSIVVDFGTAVTFDVVDAEGDYVGGIIAPGLAAMTDYLHEKTALLPRIVIREPRQAIGRNTEQAMLVGAVHGYRGLVRELIGQLKGELRARRLPVVATGGYAALIARRLPEITAVRPTLTLEGLRLTWEAHRH